MAEKMRLQKYMSLCGAASRRKSEELIAAGRVKINGIRADVGNSVDPKKDIITLDGKRLINTGKPLYLALHKPRGFVTTMSDEKGRRCVADLVKALDARVYPVGRLDRDSEGLLLMTNDGDFANKVMHPGGNISKTYRVTTKPAVNEDQLNTLCTGVLIEGQKTAPAKVKVLQEGPDKSVLEIVLYEGKNREIRKMCEAVGLDVARLKRTAEGPVKLGMLKQGRYRELTAQELNGFSGRFKKEGEKRT